MTYFGVGGTVHFSHLIRLEPFQTIFWVEIDPDARNLQYELSLPGLGPAVK